MDCEADCPICLCPILSSSSSSSSSSPSLPWGVSIPCGHAYHRECWDNVVANHLRHHGGGGNDSRGRRRRNNNNNNIVPCAICKGNTTGFVPVFIELGAAHSGCPQVVVGDGANCGVIGVDNDKEDKVNQDEEDAVEKLYDEWDGLWKELETLCGYNDQQHETTTSASSSVLERRGDREIAQICIAIDLTQPSPPPKSGTSQRSTLHQAEEGKQREVHDQINRVLNRLKAIQHDIRSKKSQRTFGGTNHHHQQQHLERLRAKIAKLQWDNSELHRESSKLQESNNSLSTKLAESEKISSDFIVEMERSKVKYESLQKQHQQSQNEIARLMAQYTNEKSTLTNTILKLRQQNTELMEDVSLENIKELEEVRTRYTKMTQAVHDAKLERNKTVLELTRKVQELEGRYEREKSEHDLLKCRMEEERFPTIDRAERHCPTTNGTSGDGSAASMRKAAPSKHQISVSSFGEESARSGAMIQLSSSHTSGNRALDVLNKTSSRKFPMHLDQPPPRRRHIPHHHHHHHQNAVLHHSTSSSSPNEEADEVESALNNGVQLLMRTGDIRHRSSKKRRSDSDTRSGRLDEGKGNNESSNSSSGHTTMKSLRTDFLAERGGVATADSTATRRRTTVVVVALNSPPSKRQGGIKSYFKSSNLK